MFITKTLYFVIFIIIFAFVISYIDPNKNDYY